MRILITHRYLWPENLSLFAWMLKDIAEWHRERGDSITILTAAVAEPNDRQLRYDWCQELDIRLIEMPVPIDRGLSAMRRAIHTLRYGLCMVKLLARERFDLVFVGSYPPIVPALIARTVGRFKGSKYIYYVQDILPESMEQKNRQLWPLTRLLKAVDTPSMNASAATITISDSMKRTLAKRGIHERKIHVLPNYSIDKVDDLSLPEATNEVTILYAGNLGKLQNLSFFLRSAALAANHCEFRIQMLGDGSETKRLKQLSVELGLSNIEFLGYRSRDEAQAIISQAHIGLIGAQPGLYDVAFPSKMMSYLQSGVPVLVQVESESSVGKFLSTHHFGVAASPGNLTSAAKSIQRMVGQVCGGHFDRSKIATEAGKVFSKQTFFRRYGEVLAECA